jgi:hypothetical protein
MAGFLERVGGPAAMLGGLLWAAGAVVTALKPEGCVTSECDVPGRSMREGGAPDAVLFVAAVLLIGLGAGALGGRARRFGRFGRSGRLGLLVAGLGAGLVLAGLLVQAVFFGGDFPYMPLVLLPGVLSVAGGVALLGVAVLRSGVLPRWVGALLVLGALAMLAFNDQNAQALMAIPFGAAWVAAGYALQSAPTDREGPVPAARPG